MKGGEKRRVLAIGTRKHEDESARRALLRLRSNAQSNAASRSELKRLEEIASSLEEKASSHRRAVALAFAVSAWRKAAVAGGRERAGEDAAVAHDGERRMRAALAGLGTAVKMGKKERRTGELVRRKRLATVMEEWKDFVFGRLGTKKAARREAEGMYLRRR